MAKTTNKNTGADNPDLNQETTNPGPDESATVQAAMEKVIKDQDAEIKDLKKKVAEANSSKRPISNEPKTFKYKNKTYPFPAPQFIVEGFGKVTASEAKKDSQILAKLVEIKAGSIE